MILKIDELLKDSKLLYKKYRLLGLSNFTGWNDVEKDADALIVKHGNTIVAKEQMEVILNQLKRNQSESMEKMERFRNGRSGNNEC